MCSAPFMFAPDPLDAPYMVMRRRIRHLDQHQNSASLACRPITAAQILTAVMDARHGEVQGSPA
jgi:hypothetical protein